MLGVVDFGIYNVVGGVVTMMTFLSGAMSSATQRFLSFELGKNDTQQLHNVFKMSLNIHLLIIVIVVLAAETVGLWFINTHLVIPVERLSAANWVFHCALFSFCCTILGVPYNASIIAHEKMSAFAYISVVDVLLKLGVVFYLTSHSGDKLQFYASLLALVSLVILGFYYAYARWQFTVTRFRWYWNSQLFQTLFSYTGWNLFGNLASVATNQGINILLNMFFGTTVNAARAIAFQVNSAITGFITSLQMSINPQIVKSYANQNYPYMLQLVFSGARYSFFLLYMLAIPFLLKTDFILKAWLGSSPEYAADFCRLVIIDSLVISLSGTLMTAFQATGKIKKYQVVVGLIIITNLPVAGVLLTLGFDSRVIMIIGVLISIIALFARVILLSCLMENTASYFVELIFRVSLFFVVSFTMSSLLPVMSCNNLSDAVFSIITYWLISFVVIFFVGLNGRERQYLIDKMHLFEIIKSRGS